MLAMFAIPGMLPSVIMGDREPGGRCGDLLGCGDLDTGDIMGLWALGQESCHYLEE